MTPFFDPVTPLEQPEPEQHYIVFPGNPPENVVPTRLDWQVEILRNPDTVLLLTDVLVFPQGFSYRVHAWIRPGTEHHGRRGPRHEHFDYAPATGWLLDDSVKIGSEREYHGSRPDDDPFAPGDPAAPKQAPRGGSGGGLTADTGGWVYPLPQGRRLQLVFAWDARGIPETYVDVDLAELRAAAGRAEVLWPIPESTHDGGWFGYSPPASPRGEAALDPEANDTVDNDEPGAHPS